MKMPKNVCVIRRAHLHCNLAIGHLVFFYIKAKLRLINKSNNFVIYVYILKRHINISNNENTISEELYLTAGEPKVNSDQTG